MALWSLWRLLSVLLVSFDFSDVLGEHQGGENTACEGDKEGG